MATHRKTLNDGENGLDFRDKLNDNFIDLFRWAETFVSTYRSAPDTFPLTTTPATIPFTDTVTYSQDVAYNDVTGVVSNVYAGIYDIDFFMSANWGNGVEITLEIYVNGLATGQKITLTGSGTSKNIPLGIPSSIILDANSDFEIKAYTTSGTTNLALVNGSVSLSLKIQTI